MRIIANTTEDGMIVMKLADNEGREHDLRLTPAYVRGLISVLTLQLSEAAGSPISLNRSMPGLRNVQIAGGRDAVTVRMHTADSYHEYPVPAATTLAGDLMACAALIAERERDRSALGAV